MPHMYLPQASANVSIVEDKGTDLMERMLLNQYQNSPNMKEYFGAFVSEMDLLFAETERVYIGRFIEHATDHSLDVIGIILDEPRGINLPTQFFGFMDDNGSNPASAEKMADENNPSDGGVFRSEGQSDTSNYVLSNVEYRRVLLAKALLTTRDECGINSAYFVISTLIGRTPQNMKFDIVGARQVTLNLSRSDTAASDQALIQYFGQYLFPLGTTFTIERI